MAIFRFNPNAPIPNNPFYSPQSSFVQADTGQLIVGTGLTVDYNAGTINATGGGGGGGAVNVVTGTSPIVVTGPVTNPVVAVLGATQTAAGVIEIATTAEVAAGVSSTLAVTPFTLSSNYMPRSGGTFTGPVTFAAPIVANSTACFVGAVTNANNVTNIGAVTNCSTTTTFGAVTNCSTTTNVGAVTNCALVTNRAAVVNCSTTTNVGLVTNCSNVITCGTTTNVGAVTNCAPVTNCSTTTNVGAVTNCALVVNCNNVITCGTTTNVGAVTNCALVTNCSAVITCGPSTNFGSVTNCGPTTFHGTTTFCNTSTFVCPSTFCCPVTFCATPILPAGVPLGCALCVTYNNTFSGLTATNVQAAIDELAASSVTPATTTSLGIVCIGSNISVTPAGEISVSTASTALPGVVQLYDGLNSPSNTLALTALQGCCLQTQINSLAVAGGIQLAGTLDGSTSLIASVTSGGSGAGFNVGSALPAASSTTNNYYVIVTVPGTVTPPGGLPTAATQGDWFLVTETSPGVYAWSFLNVGFDAPAATTTSQGIVELATNAETQAGTDTTRAITSAGLQSKVSNSVALTSSTTIASSTAVKTAYDLANAAIPKTALTTKGDLIVATGAGLYASLPVGANGRVLTANSLCASGVEWAAVTGTGSVTSITAGTGLTGGTITTSGTINLANTSVTQGTYTYPTIAVDAQGRITAAASGPNPVPCNAFISTGDLLAGTGLGTFTTVGVGIDGEVLTACSTAPGGICWAPGGSSGTVTSIATGTGLTGGPITGSGTISLQNTAVTPGNYTYANFTVDAQGRLTAAGNGVAPITALNTGTGLIGGPITGSGTIALSNTTVTAGTYSNATFVVNAQGRLTSAVSGPNPVTSVTGTGAISVTAGTTPVVSIAAGSTTTVGAVQLYDGVNSTSTSLALTAAQGKVLQDQITGLATAGGTILAGTFNASNSQMVTVTTSGSGAGFTVGSNIPSAALGNNNYYVIVTVPGSYTPPGGALVNATQGDWFLSNGTSWQFLDVGASVAYASTTTAGSVCLSTNALAQAGTDTLTALTPSTAASAFIQRACITAKGSILTGNAASSPVALGVGTDGQILTACSTAPTGLCWTSVGSSGIPCSCINAKGDLITGTAANSPLALPVGTNGQVLIADSSTVTGLRWGSGGIPCSCFTAKGQLIGASASNAPVALGAGVDGQVLTACAACTTGLVWATPSSGSPAGVYFGRCGSTALVPSGVYAATWDLSVPGDMTGVYTYSNGCFTPNVAGWYMMNLNSFNPYNTTQICAYFCSSWAGCIAAQIQNPLSYNIGLLNMSAPIRFNGTTDTASVWVYSNGTVRHCGRLTFVKVSGL